MHGMQYMVKICTTVDLILRCFSLYESTICNRSYKSVEAVNASSTIGLGIEISEIGLLYNKWMISCRPRIGRFCLFDVNARKCWKNLELQAYYRLHVRNDDHTEEYPVRHTRIHLTSQLILCHVAFSLFVVHQSY